jgi:hypothetical protein
MPSTSNIYASWTKPSPRLKPKFARLAAEHERLQARRNDANANTVRARDYLMQRYGLARPALEY